MKNLFNSLKVFTAGAVLTVSSTNFSTAQTVKLQILHFDRDSGRHSFISNSHDPRIYSSDNNGSGYPFRPSSDLGHLILQPRTSSPRDIIFATGSGTPKIRMIVEGDGDVGIGTTNPQHLLHVNGRTFTNSLTVDNDLTVNDDVFINDNLTAEYIAVNSNGTVGLQVNGTHSTWTGTYMNASSTGTPFFGYKRNGSILAWTEVNQNSTWRLMIGGTSRMWVSSAGNMTVDGKITAEEIEVKDVGADYVFEDDYKLMPLSELETYVKTEKHLPGIAPASETEKGVELAKFTEKLLEKTEELTLHVIEQQKQIEELRIQLDALRK